MIYSLTFTQKRRNNMKCNIRQFVQQYYLKTEVDRSFQRRIVWKPNNRVKFLTSLFSDRAYSSIMLVDIRACLGVCLEELDNPFLDDELYKKELIDSKRYFEKLLNKGKFYLSLDGQNRSDTINGVINNTVNLKDVSFPVKYGSTINSNHYFRKSTQYSDLPNDLKAYMDMLTCVRVNLIDNIPTLEIIRETFISENEGEPLKDIEKISAISSPMGVEVHNLSDKYAGLFQAINNKICNWKRKEDQDWLVKLIKVVRLGSDANTKIGGHKEFWKTASKLSRKEKTLIKNILDDLRLIVDSKVKVDSGWRFWAILCGLHWYYSEHAVNYDITNPIQFAEKTLDHVEGLRIEGLNAYTHAMNDWNDNGKIGIEPAISQYFSHWMGNSDVGTSRAKWIEKAFTDDFLNSLSADGIVTYNETTLISVEQEDSCSASSFA